MSDLNLNFDTGLKNITMGSSVPDNNIQITSDNKIPNISSKPGIFSAACSIELYASIFEEEGVIENLEIFSSINGPKFYNLPINDNNIILSREEWIVPEYIEKQKIKVRNFHGGKKLNWKVKNLKV